MVDTHCDMRSVIPAVIPRSRHHLDAMLLKAAAFSDAVQVDVVDGVFDDSRSWPYTTPEALAGALEGVSFDMLRVELDLMIDAPERAFDVWLATKPARMVVHVESSLHLETVLLHAGKSGYQLGLAFNNGTDLSLLSELDVACVDFIQLMGIAEIGEQGSPFDERVLGRIREVKRLLPELPVSVDGHVDEQTLPLLKRAGADRFIAGSAIWSAPDPRQAYDALCALAVRS